MRVRFEELLDAQRTGGIEAATTGMVAALATQNVRVSRSAGGLEPSSRLPDCVHFHGIWSPSLAVRFGDWKKKGVPCIVSPHGMLEPWALAHKWLKKKIAWSTYQKRLLNRAAAVHGTSNREVENFRKVGVRVPTVLIPWGVELPLLKEKSANTSVRRTALFVGRVFSVKGLPMLVEAWSKVRPPGWKMKIVGPDEAGHLAVVEALVRQCKLEEVFEFAGPLNGEALQTAYSEADLFILPSHTENFGMVVAEALASQVPVITTTGTPWHMLETEGCGWWVHANVEGIAVALENATRRTPQELIAMGQRGRAVMAERFSWDRVASEFTDCYRWVLGEGARPDCVRHF